MDYTMNDPVPAGNRRQRRARMSAAQMDPAYRRWTKSLGDVDRRCARDCYNTHLAAGLNPLEITVKSIETAYQYLAAMGQKSAQPRRLSWVKALHDLPREYQAEIGADKIPSARRGSERDVSPADNEYQVLETDIETLEASAVRSPTTDCDDHQQRSASGFKRARTRALIIAKRLDVAKLADKGLTLDKLLSTAMQTVYVQLAYGVDRASEASIAARVTTQADDDDDGDGPVLAFPLSDDLNALNFLATARYGAKSKQAKFARRQLKVHPRPPLSAKAIKILTALTQPSQLAAIRNLENVWMARAETAGHLRTRLHWADLAAAVAIGRTMLPRPADLAAMRIGGDGQPIIRLRHLETVGELRVPEDVHAVILRRAALRGIAEGEESWLFPGDDGPQLERSLSTSFAEATLAAGLIGLTPQKLRDVGAIMLLRANPGAVRRIAALLDYSEVRTVLRRYRAFLTPKKSENSTDES